ncbi:MAG: helix-turn-helix domain-containing protein [Candidatus Kapabacteria bacterium]|jgi:predicted DNA-binding transcriptional regulator AlpA|nr:helix-turn-helix domain-containing protein [Candidatus Kapabacteria bacterium]
MNANLTLSIDKVQLENLIKELVTNQPRQHEVKPVVKVVPPQLLSINDMCEMFKVSRVTISTWMKQGRLPFKKVSRRVYFILDEVLSSIPQFNLASVHSFQKSLIQGGKIDGTR